MCTHKNISITIRNVSYLQLHLATIIIYSGFPLTTYVSLLYTPDQPSPPNSSGLLFWWFDTYTSVTSNPGTSVHVVAPGCLLRPFNMDKNGTEGTFGSAGITIDGFVMHFASTPKQESVQKFNSKQTTSHRGYYSILWQTVMGRFVC